MILRLLIIAIVLLGSVIAAEAQQRHTARGIVKEDTYRELEQSLSPLATKMADPKPGEWLHEHKETGQTFAQYLQAQPVRRSQKLKQIYLCLLGDFSDEQRKVLDRTREYLAIDFDAP